MHKASIIAAALAIAAPAMGQTVVTPSRYAPAPWWMGKQVIPSLGQAKTELRANRAQMGAQFQATADTVAKATAAITARVKALNAELAAFGPERVRTEFTFQMTPIYQQYRGKGGEMVSNTRPDKIDTYQVRGRLSVEVRDVSLVEQVYGDLISALPDVADPVSFSLEPDNNAAAALRLQATQDAARRATLSADAVGAKLGAVRVIDASGAACRAAPLLAAAPPGTQAVVNGGAVDIGGQGARATLVLADGQRLAQGGGNVNRIPALNPAQTTIYGSDAIAGVVNLVIRAPAPVNIQMPLQPPMIAMEETACVVYSLD